MDLIVHIPDDIAPRLNADRAGLERRALEALALEEYKSGHITKPELRRMLGFETRFELDEFFKAHEFYDGYTVEEIEQQVEAMKKLGF